MIDRRNKNRGFKQLRVWQEAVDLFVMVHKILRSLPYDLIKSKSNALDACQSISRNIAEGYCRRSAKEYLNFINISLGSCGELNSSMISFHKAGFITKELFEQFDEAHFKLENGLIKLASSIQQKIKNKGHWDDNYTRENEEDMLQYGSKDE